MTKNDLLKGLLKENRHTYNDLAKIISRTATTVQLKLNGKRDFTWSELVKIKEYYNLSDERFMNIFFNK